LGPGFTEVGRKFYTASRCGVNYFEKKKRDSGGF
jgi:hypothetical protein